MNDNIINDNINKMNDINEKGIIKEKLEYINDVDAYISDIRKIYEKAL